MQSQDRKEQEKKEEQRIKEKRRVAGAEPTLKAISVQGKQESELGIGMTAYHMVIRCHPFTAIEKSERLRKLLKNRSSFDNCFLAWIVPHQDPIHLNPIIKKLKQDEN